MKHPFTIPKCYSILVASGNGSRCSELTRLLRAHLLQTDDQLGIRKVLLHKHCKEAFPELHAELCQDIATLITPLFQDVPARFFLKDAKTDHQRN